MNDFEIVLPNETPLVVDVLDKNLYNYDFTSFSLLPLQETASMTFTQKIKSNIFSNISRANLIKQLSKQGETEYVANISDFAKEKLNSGEWSLGIRKKTGETYAVIKDTVSGKNKSFVTLDKKVVQNLGVLPELSAIQGQLASISEQIENLNRTIQRVEQGQYNDRFAGFFSARQLIVEGLASESGHIKKELLLSSIKLNNDTIGKLMFSIHHDALALIDIKTKPKDAIRIDNLLQTSLGYLNSSVQLNLIAYTALGEQQSLFAVLTNYHSFIEQELMRQDKYGRTVAWSLDNGHIGNGGKIVEFSTVIYNKIENIIESQKLRKIGVLKNESIKNEDM